MTIQTRRALIPRAKEFFGLRHPARHYIYFLLSRRTYSLEEVVKLLQVLDLPAPLPIGDTTLRSAEKKAKEGDLEAVALRNFLVDLLAVKGAMQFPVRFNPQDRPPNEETRAFLKTWSIAGAWGRDPMLGCALDILSDPQLRQSVEIMLLGPLNCEAIARRVRQRFGLSEQVMNLAVVRTFGHYFWDYRALSLSEWRTFLERYYTEELLDYLAALEAPRNDAGAAFSIAAADRDPTLLNPAARYELASSVSFKRFMEHSFVDKPSGCSTRAAFTALMMMKTADECLDVHRGGSAELLKEFERLRTIYDQGKPLTIRDSRFARPAIVETTAEEIPND